MSLQFSSNFSSLQVLGRVTFRLDILCSSLSENFGVNLLFIKGSFTYYVINFWNIPPPP